MGKSDLNSNPKSSGLKDDKLSLTNKEDKQHFRSQFQKKANHFSGIDDDRLVTTQNPKKY